MNFSFIGSGTVWLISSAELFELAESGFSDRSA